MRNIVLFIFLLSSTNSYGFSLQSGFKSDENVDILRVIYGKYKTLPGYLVEYGANKFYSLSPTGNAIGYYDLTTANGSHGGWPLTRWPHQYFSPDIEEQYADLTTNFPLPLEYESIKPGPGCLGDTPLRYGDIEADGKNEVVVILGGLFIIFSPDYQRIVYSEYLDESDWYTAAEANEVLEGKVDPTIAQYISRLWIDNSNRRGPGVRAYAKLYFGDFDKDGNLDILAWRKSYRSNAGNDPVPGFTKLRDSWQHFELDLKTQADSTAGVTGEYLPQETDEATIKTWLTDNALTWKKGYPDVSECAADNGGPIPEMSDPLLNDPEVLQ